MEPVSLETVMIEYWWLLAVYSVGSGLLGWALCLAWTMIKEWWSRREDKLADPDVERITDGWRIQDDPNRDWATGENKIPAYVDAYDVAPAHYETVPAQPGTYRSRFAEFVAQTRPRSAAQYAIEMSPRPYVARHSAVGYSDIEVKQLNTGTGYIPAIRTLAPDWREAVAV